VCLKMNEEAAIIYKDDLLQKGGRGPGTETWDNKQRLATHSSRWDNLISVEP
jgi:hypothetical protein